MGHHDDVGSADLRLVNCLIVELYYGRRSTRVAPDTIRTIIRVVLLNKKNKRVESHPKF